MKWYMIFNDFLIALFYYFILSDLIYLKTEMSSGVESKCIAVILTAIGLNILLSLIQSIIQIFRMIKALKERWRLKKIQPELIIITSGEQQPEPHLKAMRNTEGIKGKIEGRKCSKSFREIKDI